MEFAELVLTAKTEGLKRGARDLDGLRASGARAEAGVTQSTSKMSSGFAMAARSAGALGAAMLATFGAASVVRGIAEFDQSTAKLGAISRATTGEMEAMRVVAQDLGASTEFSATQAADALTFLSMAGFSARESLASIPAVLDLATAAGMGLAEAADTASNIMSGFGIAATEAASVTDILAAASTRANTNVSQLGSAMSTVAPIAATLNIGIEDTAAAIGVLSDAGIQGERAGTALRGVLAALAGPTKAATDALASYGLTAADVDVSTRSLADVMTTLSSVGMSTADAMEIFGREAASGALVMIGASDRVREFGAELRDVDGAASDMAGQIRDNLTGDMQGLSSAAAGLVIAMGDAGLTTVLRNVVQAMTGFVRGAALVVSQIGDMIGVVRQLFSEQARVEKAIDNTRMALTDEATALANLEPAMAAGATMSVGMAQYKLREAMSRRDNITAIIEEQRVLAMQTGEYRDLTRQIDDLRQKSGMLGNTGRDGGSFAPNANRADLEYQRDEAMRLAAARAKLLDVTGDSTAVMQENERTIAALTAALSAAEDGSVTFAGQTLTTAEATDRLDTALESLGAAASGAAAVPPVLGDIETEADRAQQAAERMGQTLASATSSAVFGANSARDAFGRLFSQLAQMAGSSAIQSLFGILAPAIAGMFGPGMTYAPAGGGLTASTPNLLPNAKGNAFSGGRVTPFAQGGVVNGPTMFPMRGGTGLMGEAGPEAIMPLARTANGKLGVQTAGGAQTLSVSIGFDPSMSSFTAQIRDETGKIVASGIQAYDRMVAPQTAQRAMADPRRRG